MGYCNPQVYIPTNVLQRNKSSYIVMLQTSYPQNYVARKQQYFDNPWTLNPTNKIDSTVFIKVKKWLLWVLLSCWPMTWSECSVLQCWWMEWSGLEWSFSSCPPSGRPTSNISPSPFWRTTTPSDSPRVSCRRSHRAPPAEFPEISLGGFLRFRASLRLRRFFL